MSAPERIYLQDAGDYEGAAQFEVTWCVEPQDEKDTSYIRADLAPPPAKVRALVWRKDTLSGSYPQRYKADMPCGSGDYSLAGSERENLWQWYRNGYFVNGHQMHKPMPLEAAKRAAQDDYTARILAALEEPHERIADNGSASS